MSVSLGKVEKNQEVKKYISTNRSKEDASFITNLISRVWHKVAKLIAIFNSWEKYTSNNGHEYIVTKKQHDSLTQKIDSVKEAHIPSSISSSPSAKKPLIAEIIANKRKIDQFIQQLNENIKQVNPNSDLKLLTLLGESNGFGSLKNLSKDQLLSLNNDISEKSSKFQKLLRSVQPEIVNKTTAETEIAKHKTALKEITPGFDVKMKKITDEIEKYENDISQNKRLSPEHSRNLNQQIRDLSANISVQENELNKLVQEKVNESRRYNELNNLANNKDTELAKADLKLQDKTNSDNSSSPKTSVEDFQKQLRTSNEQNEIEERIETINNIDTLLETSTNKLKELSSEIKLHNECIKELYYVKMAKEKERQHIKLDKRKYSIKTIQNALDNLASLKLKLNDFEQNSDLAMKIKTLNEQIQKEQNNIDTAQSRIRDIATEARSNTFIYVYSENDASPTSDEIGRKFSDFQSNRTEQAY